MAERKLFNKRDIWLFMGLVMLALLVYVCYGRGLTDETFAQITVDGQIILTMPLDTSGDTKFDLEQPNVQFLFTDGMAAFIKSDCPDQICVHNGFLSRPGQVAICLPNRTSLLIIGTSDNGADTFAY